MALPDFSISANIPDRHGRDAFQIRPGRPGYIAEPSWLADNSGNQVRRCSNEFLR